MLSPALAILGVVITFAVSLWVFSARLLPVNQFFFLPVLLLIGYHTVVMQIQDRQRITRNAGWTVLKKSLGKYVFWLAILAVLEAIYSHHPFYRQFAAHTIRLVEFVFQAYVWVGLPYFLVVERYKTGRFEWLNDSYLKILSLIKAVVKRRWKSLRFRILKKGYKSLLLSWLLRLHFIPVMVEQVYWGSTQTLHFLSQPQWVLANVMFWVGVFFLIDSINASMGYFWESTLTKTRFRAVDPNAFHWIVVLMCYMPFIAYASNFIPFPKGDGALIWPDPTFELVVNVLTVLSLVGIVLCTTCLGFSYSNLCYKKIQNRGPYAIVRHPGTVFKIAFFFLTVFRFEAAYTAPIIAAYVFWMGVYIVRILCEERFLMNFKEYQDYAKVTRYRLIPGVW